VAVAVGVGTGYYIFDEPLRRFAAEQKEKQQQQQQQQQGPVAPSAAQPPSLTPKEKS
jgi:hypothetical protein